VSVSRRGARILVGQVAIVLALLLVVYLTLLRPEGHKPLFGIGTSTGAGQIAQSGGAGTVGAGQATVGPGGHSGHGQGRRGGGAAGRGGGTLGGIPPAFGATPASATLPGAVEDGLPGRGGGGGALTPSQDQYEDTIGQVFGRL
jgi:hypothetical protein